MLVRADSFNEHRISLERDVNCDNTQQINHHVGILRTTALLKEFGMEETFEKQIEIFTSAKSRNYNRILL